jgi:hypothetical protein
MPTKRKARLTHAAKRGCGNNRFVFTSQEGRRAESGVLTDFLDSPQDGGDQRLATKRLYTPWDFTASPLHRFVRRLPSRETNLFHPVAPTFHNKTLVTFRSHEVKPVWNNPSRRARLNVRNVCQGHGKFVPLDVEAMRPE